MIENVFLGIAKMDITPLHPVKTIGFNRKDNLSRGILHHLYAQISIWIYDDERYCLLTIDHIGCQNSEANIIRDEIAKKLNITREKVMICFSHTHSAPNISIEAEYFIYMRKQILLGLIEAEKNMAPVKAVWGANTVDIAINRRDVNGRLDKRVNVLKVVDANTNQLRLLLLRLTAHANVLKRDNHLISSDFIGVTRDLLEQKYQCEVMITQGAAGNVEPKQCGTVEDLETMALKISHAVEHLIDNLKPTIITKFEIFSNSETFCADVPTLNRAQEISEEAMSENNIDGTQWLEEVARLNDENIKHQKKDIEIQFFIVNNGCFCGVVNEIMCELALDVSKICEDDLIYLGGYTNGCGGYLPTAEEYDRGGYEVLHSYLMYYIYHGTVMPLNRDTADKLVHIISNEWNKLKK